MNDTISTAKRLLACLHRVRLVPRARRFGMIALPVLVTAMAAAVLMLFGESVGSPLRALIGLLFTGAFIASIMIGEALGFAICTRPFDGGEVAFCRAMIAAGCGDFELLDSFWCHSPELAREWLRALREQCIDLKVAADAERGWQRMEGVWRT